jgi:hypothetical protein
MRISGQAYAVHTPKRAANVHPGAVVQIAALQWFFANSWTVTEWTL